MKWVHGPLVTPHGRRGSNVRPAPFSHEPNRPPPTHPPASDFRPSVPRASRPFPWRRRLLWWHGEQRGRVNAGREQRPLCACDLSEFLTRTLNRRVHSLARVEAARERDPRIVHRQRNPCFGSERSPPRSISLGPFSRQSLDARRPASRFSKTGCLPLPRRTNRTVEPPSDGRRDGFRTAIGSAPDDVRERGLEWCPPRSWPLVRRPRRRAKTCTEAKSRSMRTFLHRSTPERRSIG